MLRVAILLDNTLQTDRRALLEITSLRKLPIALTLYCNQDEGLPAEEHENNFIIKRVFNAAMWQFSNRHLLDVFAQELIAENYEVLHCHDQYLLHVGSLVKKRNPQTVLIYESRELFHSWPVNFSNQSFINRIKTYIVRYYETLREKRNGKNIDYLITVNQSIADILKRYFKLKTPPVVTRNIPAFKALPPKDYSLRHKFNIPDNDKVIVFIGVNVYRHTNKMENFVDTLAKKKGFHLIIITRRNERRIWFENYVKEQQINNIYFHDLIPVNKIEETISCCDIGLVTSWYKKKRSYWLALDNKLFTYIMSELPLLGTAQPEFEKVIIKYQVGLCINPEKTQNINNALDELIKNKDFYSNNCRSAKQELCWEKEEAALLQLYRDLMKSMPDNG
jgi:glycosyltransferase involved in cell wall biosynthesis